MWNQFTNSKWNLLIRLKKNPMSQSCRAHLFFRARLIPQNSRFEFFLLAYFFSSFYELACQNIQEKIWQTQWSTLNNRLLQLCVLSCILFIQNQVPYFKAVTDSNLTRLLLKKKKKKKKKKCYKTAFRSGLPICHEFYWQSIFFFFSLILTDYYFMVYLAPCTPIPSVNPTTGSKCSADLTNSI